jgi:glutathione synthase
MRFLFVMDPAEGMLPTKDTSFALMSAAQTRGHEIFHCLPRDLSHVGRELSARAAAIRVSADAPHTTVSASESSLVESFDAVLIRKDPPFDSAYLHLTQQLELVRGKTLIVNDPRALRDANEKLFAFEFAQFMPRTLVSANTNDLLAFLKQVGGEGVIKPLDGAGGSGVIGLRAGDRNARGIVDYLTSEGSALALVQEFQPDVVNGDKRILLLDGRALGAIRRVPQADDIRANIHVGGRVEATTLTPEEQALVDCVAPQLAARGLYFVGLDLIGGKLIEVNVTSPTGIQELGRLTNTKPSEDVVTWLESKAQGIRSR